MNCPRCERPTLEEKDRSGVTIDVCTQCKGVWLDRGELEKIVARAQAEIEELERTVRTPPPPPAPVSPQYQPAPQPAPQPVRPPADPRDVYKDHERRYDRDHSDYHYDKHGRRRKKGGFLDVLGDIFD